ncbi:MAG: hypothetical protein ACOCVF_04330 [bacterium]
MLTFFGVLIVLFGISMFIIRPFLSTEDKYEEKTNRYGDKVKTKVAQKSHPLLIKFSESKIRIAIITFGLFITIIPYVFFYAERGYNYLLVYPNGKMDAVMEQGIKMRWFAKIDPWQKYIDVKTVDEKVQADVSELEGVMNPIDIRFIDQVTAKGYVSLRFKLPEDKGDFISLAVKFRTMGNLVYNTIVPTVREQLINTGYMFAAQNYISGDAQIFRQTYEEQLKSGTFAVNKREYKDTIYFDQSIDMREQDRQIREIRTSYTVEKVEKNGIPVRIPHELSENNIIVSQVIVDDIDLESAFRQRLEAQRDESAKRQLAHQQIETAKAEQQRIIAQGERDKAEERAQREREQVSQLIQIETKLKQESTNRDLAAIALETEKLNAERIRVSSSADAFRNRQLVSAGLTPQERAYWDFKRDSIAFSSIGKMEYPDIMIIGGEDGSTTPLESLIGSAMAKQLLGDK